MESGGLVTGKRSVLLGLATISALATLLTGFFIGNWSFDILGTRFWMWGRGFPFRWITAECPPPGSGIMRPCGPIGYDWFAFGLDMLFYMGIGYALVLAYDRLGQRTRPQGRNVATTMREG